MKTEDIDTERRRFLAYLTAVGLGSTLLPGVLWAQSQENPEQPLTKEMIKAAAVVAGLDFSDDECEKLRQGIKQNIAHYAATREIDIDDDIGPPFYFSPIVPSTKLDREDRGFHAGPPPVVERPADLEQTAFWSVRQLGELLRTRQATSTELTEMYLARLRRHNPRLNCVVSFLDPLALQQARLADNEIGAGHYRGALHGIPWGCKDVIAVPDYPTTWGAFKDQFKDREATVVRLLREAGAVLVAKLSTGELAVNDVWFGGRTNNPWNPKLGSSGSSAGPACATAAGLVGFSIGTETFGSLLAPTAICGATGLRPTFGRVSRYGAMTLSWTADRVGPICRAVEDCALVLKVIAQPDSLDGSVIGLPFNWDASLDVTTLKVGYLKQSFAESAQRYGPQNHDQRVLDQLIDLGIKPEGFDVPDIPGDALDIFGYLCEAPAFFDRLLRQRGDTALSFKPRSINWRRQRLVPAVEYLQTQRIRHFLMRKFAEVVDRFDVYVTPTLWFRSAEETRHFRIANIAGYPAVAVPNGFDQAGMPTSIAFLGRIYNEAKILAVAHAYQRATNWHLKRPPLP